MKRLISIKMNPKTAIRTVLLYGGGGSLLSAAATLVYMLYIL